MLLRSGEATNYSEIMDRIMHVIGTAPPTENGKKGADTNGVSTGNPIADMEKKLRIPDKAVMEGARAIRKELEKICDIVVDDV